MELVSASMNGAHTTQATWNARQNDVRCSLRDYNQHAIMTIQRNEVRMRKKRTFIVTVMTTG